VTLPTRGELISIVLAFCGIAVMTTYPLVRHLGGGLPSDLGDPLLIAWTLAWDASRIPHALSGLWTAPNFFPYRYTLAFSDHLLGIAAFTAPIQWLTGNPILAHNIAYLASIVFAGTAMYVLTRAVTGRRDAALVGAIVFACLPFRASHLAHLQWLTVGWMPLGLWALHRYGVSRARRHLALAAMCFLFQGLTAGYLFYFALLPFGIVAARECIRRRLPVMAVLRDAAPLIVGIAIVMIPIARGYRAMQREQQFHREAEDIRNQSADAADYLRAAPRLRLWGRLGTTGGEHELFPGAVAIVTSLVALGGLRRSFEVKTYAAIAAVAFVLSLGPSPAAWGHSLGFPGPYGWLLKIVPGLDALRAVARLGLIVSLALSVLAALGAKRLFEWAPQRARVVAVTLLVVLAIADGWAAPIPTPQALTLTQGERDAYQYLRTTSAGAVLEVPTSTAEFERESRYQYLTLIHGHRVVNGLSGFVPPLASFLSSAQSPLNELTRLGDAVAAIRAAGVKYLVVHFDAFTDAPTANAWQEVLAAERSQILAQRRFDTTSVVALLPQPAAASSSAAAPIPASTIQARSSHAADRLPLAFDANADTRWLTGVPQGSGEWIELRFDRPRDVAVVRMLMATRSLGDYPRLLEVEATIDQRSTVLFRGSVLPALVNGLLQNGEYPPIDVTLPPNESQTLRLRQLGTTNRRFWSIHELEIFERR
jgi:hypothetical protein